MVFKSHNYQWFINFWSLKMKNNSTRFDEHIIDESIEDSNYHGQVPSSTSQQTFETRIQSYSEIKNSQQVIRGFVILVGGLCLISLFFYSLWKIGSLPALNPSFPIQQYKSMQSAFGDKFNIPKIIWLYHNPNQTSEIQQLNIKNIKRFAAVTNHSLKIVTRQTYKQHFLYDSRHRLVEDIQNSIKYVKKRELPENQQYSETIIALALLQQYGGIYINDTLTLTEPLSWLQTISKEDYINSIDRSMPTQFFAFHDATHSTTLTKPNFKGTITNQFMRVIPGLQSFFMASYPHTEFIIALNKQFKRLIRLKEGGLIKFVNTLKNQRNQNIYRPQDEAHMHIFSIAATSVLMRKQTELKSPIQNISLFGIDYYGVRSINRFYFPHKIDYMLDKHTFNNTYYHLSKISLNQLEVMTGPLRFMLALTPLKLMSQLLNMGRDGDQLKFIYKNSFLQRFLFPNVSQPWIIESFLNFQKTDKKNQKTQWSSLPKKIWVFWSNGIQNSSVTHQLCTRNIKALSALSGFTYYEVTRSNLHQYIDNITIDRINTTFKNSPHRVLEQSFSDFVRLALLKKYGGIYMDASYMLLNDLDWLINIQNYPQQLIYNAYGAHPKVFIFFNPELANAIYQTQIDREYQVKSQWHLGYESSFIAAEPNNQLISQWFQQFIAYHTMDFDHIKEKFFSTCNLGDLAWSSIADDYLYIMDSLKCVIGRKNRQLIKANATGESPSSKYYQIWSLNGYNGGQKLRYFMNYQNPRSDNNIFVSHFSQDYVDKILGKHRQVIKFFGPNSHALARTLIFQMKDVHQKSITALHLMKYKYQNETIRIVNGEPLLVKT